MPGSDPAVDLFAALRRIPKALLDTVELVLDVLLGPVDVLLESAFLAPFAGPILFYLYKALVSLVWRLMALPDVALGRFLPARRLALRMIVLSKGGTPLISREAAESRLDEAAAIFWKRARVRLVPVSFAWDIRPPRPLVELARQEPDARALTPGCDQEAFRQDLSWRSASQWYKAYMVRDCLGTYLGGARRLLGVGRPIYVFVVERVKGTGGCSLGPLADYIVVGASSGGLTIAHEVAHACGLWHTKDTSNLMKHLHSRDEVSPLQVAVLRSSEHVVLF